MQIVYRRLRVITGFLVLLIALITNAWVIRHQLGVQIDNQARMSSSREALLDLAKIELLLNEAETGQRGFLYTGDPKYLAPYNHAKSQIAPYFAQVEQLTVESPDQQTRISLLRNAIDKKLGELSQTISLFQSGKTGEAKAMVVSNAGQMMMDRTRNLLDEMRRDEDSLVTRQSVVYLESKRVTIASIYTTNFLAAMALIVLAFHIHREIKAREKDARKIEAREEELRESEALLRTVTDHSHVGLTMLSATRCYVYANAAYRSLFELSTGDFSGRLASDVLGQVYERIRPWLDRAYSGERVSFELELPAISFKGRQGLDRCYAITYEPFRNDGEPLSVIGVTVDVTERRQAEEGLRRSQDQLRALSARLQTATERERLRMARELHDQLGQVLTGMKMDLDWIVRKHGTVGDVWVSLVQNCMKVTDSTIGLVRRLATELRPEILDAFGLRAAIRWHTEKFQQRTGTSCVVVIPEQPLGLTEDQKIAVFRIFQEALTNIARHAKAKNVLVTLERERNDMILSINDDGVGFVVDPLELTQSLGILGMRERALILNAEFLLQSEPGHGTTATLRIPLEEVGEAAPEAYEHIDR